MTARELVGPLVGFLRLSLYAEFLSESTVRGREFFILIQELKFSTMCKQWQHFLYYFTVREREEYKRNKRPASECFTCQSDMWQGQDSLSLSLGFCNGGGGGIIASAEHTSLVGGSGGISPPRKFQIWRLRNAIFSSLSWDMSPKNRPPIWKWQTIASH